MIFIKYINTLMLLYHTAYLDNQIIEPLVPRVAHDRDTMYYIDII